MTNENTWGEVVSAVVAGLRCQSEGLRNQEIVSRERMHAEDSRNARRTIRLLIQPSIDRMHRIQQQIKPVVRRR